MKKGKHLLKLLAITAVAVACFFLSFSVHAQNYYVSNNGDDTNNGTSESTPWRTVERVNLASLKPGDTVKFRCGDTWRGQIRPLKGGIPNSCITYTSYEYVSNGKTIKDKPAFLGSISANNSSDWKHEGNNIWSLNVKKEAKDISTIENNGSTAEVTTSTGILGPDCSVKCVDTSSKTMLFTNKFNIEVNKYYLVTFNAKTESGIYKIPDINIRPKEYATCLGVRQKGSTLEVNSEEKEYKIYLKAMRSQEDAVAAFNLSNLPQNFKLYLKNIRIYEFNNLVPIKDVGNIIFDDSNDFGVKAQNVEELKAEKQFWYDDNNDNIKLVSSINPALKYKSIEIAISNYIVDQWEKSNIIYSNLEFKYGGASGMQIGYSSNTTIESCKLSYIGGGYVFDGAKNDYYYDTQVTDRKVKTRFGNGICFWQRAANNSVINCSISQIYDSGLANELWASNTSQSNIIFRNNTIKNCEMSFEFINKGVNSTMQAINFVNNNCSDAGYNWGHNQRPEIGIQTKRGAHVTAEIDSNTIVNNVSIQNNIFSNATEACLHIYVPQRDGYTDMIMLNNNKYYQPSGGKFAYWRCSLLWNYMFGDFDRYRKDLNEDINSTLTEIN